MVGQDSVIPSIGPTQVVTPLLARGLLLPPPDQPFHEAGIPQLRNLFATKPFPPVFW